LPVSVPNRCGLGQESRKFAGIKTLLTQAACGEQFDATGIELAM
jgi:hypothetical protein